MTAAKEINRQFKKQNLKLNKPKSSVKNGGVEPDQLWILGNHRLLCGDSTNIESIKRVMLKDTGLCLSDPPYGVNIVNKKSGAVGGGDLASLGEYAPIIGDQTTETAKKFYTAITLVGFTEIILWGGNYFTDFLPISSCWFIWDKRRDTPSNNFADCELAWTSFKKSARIFRQVWNGMIREGESSPRVHPTQKPVNLMTWCIEHSNADSIFDGFLGSGTTLIACEQLNKKCRAIEISPEYVAIALQRWADATGNTPILK